MLQIQPDAVEPEVSGLLNERRNIMAKAAHTDRLVTPNPGQRLAFSHRGDDSNWR
jgi:hypothetical protein